MNNLARDLAQIEAVLATIGTVGGIVLAVVPLGGEHTVLGAVLTAVSVLAAQLPKIGSDAAQIGSDAAQIAADAAPVALAGEAAAQAVAHP